MIDPKIWESEQVMNLSPFEFKVYIFLISSADDEGRLKVSYPIFVARIYPDGKFNSEVVKLVKESGFTYAVSILHGKLISSKDSIYTLRRIEAVGDSNIFKVVFCGLWGDLRAGLK